VLSFGPEARAVARRWCAEIDDRGPLWTLHAARADGPVLASLRERLGAALVGWRLLLAGPEVDVLAARSLAIEHGAVAAEIVAYVTSSVRKRVYCAHCRELTSTGHAAGETVRCRNCNRDLVIHHHVSRRIGAYLGFAADTA
jgi:dimethylamine monooxygenase subunit C